jgi:hypothetical protein
LNTAVAINPNKFYAGAGNSNDLNPSIDIYCNSVQYYQKNWNIGDRIMTSQSLSYKVAPTGPIVAGLLEAAGFILSIIIPNPLIAAALYTAAYAGMIATMMTQSPMILTISGIQQVLANMGETNKEYERSFIMYSELKSTFGVYLSSYQNYTMTTMINLENFKDFLGQNLPKTPKVQTE